MQAPSPTHWTAAVTSMSLDSGSNGENGHKRRVSSQNISRTANQSLNAVASLSKEHIATAVPSFLQTRNKHIAQQDRWQFDVPLTIILSLLVLDFMGVEQARVFTRLQYCQPAHHGPVEGVPIDPLDGFSPITNLPGPYYRLGRLDAFFVAYMTLALTLFRSCVMRYLLEPLGKYYGIRNLSKLERFKEQGYQCVYYSISWVSGMYIMYNSPYWFDTKHFWINYPHRDYTWHSKTYYLMSLAYTIHLMYVLHVEAKRKDYRAMFAHHIVTALLITCSYVTHFPRIGNAVLCMMDFADIILPLAKCMRYTKFQRICDVTFGVFVLAWIYTRFYLYAQICYAIYAEAEKYIKPIWDPVRGVFLTRNARIYFLTLFAGLQVLIIYWFVLICRVLWRVISGANAHDNRSSGSEEEEDEKEMERMKKQRKPNTNSSGASSVDTPTTATAAATIVNTNNGDNDDDNDDTTSKQSSSYRLRRRHAA